MAGAGGGAASDASLDALSTANVALIDEELAEHLRWGAASTRVGAAGSATRARFLAEQADAGALGGGTQALVTGAAMGAATRAIEIAGERAAIRLAGQAAGRSAPIPAIGAVIGGVMSAMDLAERDWGQTGQTIGRFGQGASDYDMLANSIAAVSEIISVYTALLNVIAGVIGAISIVMWIITIVTVGVASPLAATLSSIAAGIGIGTMILDAINALVLQPLIMTFRALHAFNSQADPTQVEEQGGQVRQAAAAGAGFVGGFAGGLAGSHGASAAGRRMGLVPPHAPPTPHETPPPAAGDGPTIHADPPPPDAAPRQPDTSQPARAPDTSQPAHAPDAAQPAAAPDVSQPARQPGDPILPPADPNAPQPQIPGSPRMPDIPPPEPGAPREPDTHPVSPDRQTVPAPADPNVDPYQPTHPPAAPDAQPQSVRDAVPDASRPPAADAVPDASRPPAADEFRMADDEPARQPDERSGRTGELEPTDAQLADMGLTRDQYEIQRDMGQTGAEPDLNQTPGRTRSRMQPRERMPGRIETPARVKADARARARAGLERQTTAALLDEGQLTPQIHETIDTMRPDQRVEMEQTGRLPEQDALVDQQAQAEAEGRPPPDTPQGSPGPRAAGSFDVRHRETVADSPHTAHIPERQTAGPHGEHMMEDHAMRPRDPLEASAPLDPNAQATWGYQIDEKAQPPAARATDANPSGRLAPQQDFGLRPGSDANILAETRQRAAAETDPVARQRLLDAADQLERQMQEQRAAPAEDATQASPDAVPDETPLDVPDDEHHMADPAQPPGAPPPGAPPPTAPPPRRSTAPIGPEQRAQLLQMAQQMGYPPERVQFHDGPTSVLNGVLRIGPDVNPLPPGQRPTGLANPANVAVEARGVLGHEIIGHIEAQQAGQRQPMRSREEFQASTRAALHTPDLPRDQQALLMQDASRRLRNDPDTGTFYVYTDRPNAPQSQAPSPARPPGQFRPQDQLPSVVVDWNAVGARPPEGTAAARAPQAQPVAPTPRGGGSSQSFGEPHPDTTRPAPRAAPAAPTFGSRASAAIDSMRHGYVGTIGAGLWSAVPGVEQVHRVGRIGSEWFGDERLRAPASRRDAMGNPIGYSRGEQRAISAGGTAGAVLGGMYGGPLGAYVGQRVGEGVARRGADFAEGLTRGATEPIVERVNPSYPPPPEGGMDQINALQERLARILEARANAEAAQQSAQADAAHHQANAAPLTQFDQRTTQTISATQAHQAAVQRRQQANEQRQQREGDVSTALADAQQRRTGLSTLTIPLSAFRDFSSLGEYLPDGIPFYSTALVGPKRKIRQINRDATDFLNALNGVDSTITEQRAATGPRQQETAQHAGRLGTTHAQAGAAQSSLGATRQQGQALARRNQQRTASSRAAAGDSAAQGARLDGEAQRTQADIQSTAERWQAWAQAHRQARQAAIAQRRRMLEDRGYRVREVSGQ
jgi:hypothetical protein